MISIIIFTMFIFYSIKDHAWISNLFYSEDTCNFMTCIIPLIMLIINFMYFNKSKRSETIIEYFFFSLIMLMCAMCFYSETQFMYLLLLEMTVFPMTMLILNFSKDSDKMLSMLLMFSLNMMGSIIFMLYASKIEKMMFNSYCISLLSSTQSFESTLFASFVLIFLAKLPLLFFHFWLTKAHVSASGTCSMLLASLMLKLGSFGLYKFMAGFIFCSMMFFSIEASISVCSCLFFSIVMLRFFDLKYMVACSSILHMSLIFCMICTFKSVGVISSLYMMTGHGLVSYFLFFMVTIFYENTMSRTSDFNKSLESVTKSSMMWLSIYILMNLGVPPLINFLSELMFCTSLSMISIVSLLIFCLSMLLSIMFTMFCLTSMTFMKKSMYTVSETNLTLSMLAFMFLFYLFLLPMFLS